MKSTCIRTSSPIRRTVCGWGGQPATSRGGDWVATVRLRSGDNQLIAQATDAHGNTGQAVPQLLVLADLVVEPIAFGISHGISKR